MTDHYPNVPGWKGTDTSRQAAFNLIPKISARQQEVYECLRGKPQTAEEVRKSLDKDLRSIAPRLSELRAKNLIEDSGERRKTDMGKKAVVWRIV